MADTPVTILSDAVIAMATVLQNQIDDLKKDVAALKGGAPVVPPVTPPPSPSMETPNLTTVAAGSGQKITDHVGNVWEIGPDRKIVINQAPDGSTANVELIAKVDPDIWQTAIGRWWSKAADTKPPVAPWMEQSAAPPGVVLPAPPPIVAPPVGGPSDVIRFNPGSPRPVVQGGVNAITVKIGERTGAFACKAAFGCAAQGLDNISWGGQYRMLLDPVFQAACADFGFRFVRINGLGAIRDSFGGNANSTPNWTWLDNIAAGFRKCFPLAQFCMSFSGNGDFNYGDANLRANFANAVKQVVQRFRDRGLKIDFVGSINEPDGGGTPPKVGPSDVGATIAAFRQAMPTEALAGPFTSWGRTDFAQSAAQAGAKLISWHYYNHANGDQRSDDQIWGDAAGFGSIVAAMQSAARAGGQTEPILGVTEYGLDWTPGGNNDPRQQNYKGAIFSSLLLMSGIYGGLSGATIWRVENFDGSYGVFRTGTLQKNPNGALLQALNRYAGGDVAPIAIASTGTQKLLGLCTTTATDFAVVLTNYDTTSPWTGPVNLPGRISVANLTRFDLNETATGGLSGSVPTSALGSVTLPRQGITILAGAR